MCDKKSLLNVRATFEEFLFWVDGWIMVLFLFLDWKFIKLRPLFEMFCYQCSKSKNHGKMHYVNGKRTSDKWSDPLATTASRQLMIAQKYIQQESSVKINSMNSFLSIHSRLTHNKLSTRSIFTHCERRTRSFSLPLFISLSY